MHVSHPGPSPLGAAAARPGPPSLARRLRRAVVGPPRPLNDKRLFHKISLVAVLAWVGLGADGLSSSAYGPEEAFRALGEHRSLAVALALLMITTVLVISAAYSRIIRRFPHGGGGYVVATKILGPTPGLTSGCALVVDYVLTVTISIAAAGDALFSVLPPSLLPYKLPAAVAVLIGLTIINIRGVRESVVLLAPIFFVFVITHAVVIAAGFVGHIPQASETAREIAGGFSSGASSLGVLGLVFLLFHAFSMGGGTYTGIEAVSNGIPIMRHPQVQTAQRTMIYMAVSLALTATGLLLLYLLWDIRPVDGKTMNAVLVERIASGWPLGAAFVFVTMTSSAALLVVAAQAGFVDGPRVLANMALDSWVPRKFASLSERLTTQNGILLVGGAALVALLYTRGSVQLLVVMYAINVFVTFSISMLAMLIDTWRTRRTPAGPGLRRSFLPDLGLFGVGLALCLTILIFTVIDKFTSGGWVTLLATGGVVLVCVLTKRHYTRLTRTASQAFAALVELPDPRSASTGPALPSPDPTKPTAVVLVSAFGGLGLHTLLNAMRLFPNHFASVVFVTVGVIDSGRFKGPESLDDLQRETADTLGRYIDAARRLGLPAAGRSAIGTDPVAEAESLCLGVSAEFPRAVFFAGQLVFRQESLIDRLLHNQTAHAIQRRLHWAGQSMVILPARIATP